MSHEKFNLKELIQRVENFPKKISYDVMIPLSKVAFCPGRIVHTNEMKLVEKSENLASTSFQSAYDVAQTLKSRLPESNNEILEISAGKPAKSALKSSGHSKDHEKKHVMIDEGLNTTNVIQNTKPVASPTSLSSSSSSSIVPSKSNATTPSPTESVFEIREFLDEHNQAQNCEILDVTKQLQYMENMAEVSAVAHSEEDEFIRELAAIAEHKEQARREKLNPKTQVEGVDDLLQILEKLEVKQAEKEQNKNKPPASGKGWKQGFLSSQSSTKGEKRSVKTVPLQPLAPMQRETISPAPPMPSTTVEQVEKPNSNSSTSISASETRKKPFSGVILEKF